MVDEERVKRLREEITAKAEKWKNSLEGRRTRKEADEAYAKSGDLGDFVAIMLGGKKVPRTKHFIPGGGKVIVFKSPK